MTNSGSFDVILQHAAGFRDAGRLGEAADLLADVLRSHGNAYAVAFQLALVETERGRFAIAERAARSAVLSGTDEYAIGLGQVLAKTGRYEEAEHWLRRAIAFEAGNAMAHALLGAIYSSQGRVIEGLSCLDMALSLRSDFPEVRLMRKRVVAQHAFQQTVRTAFIDYARAKGIDVNSEPGASNELEFPSAFLDVEGNPRFMMALPASIVFCDLGAAHLFYDEIAGGGYEFALRRFLDLHLGSDDVFIDVGAHWGIHSLTAATSLPNQIDVLAIEAHPQNAARLQEWVARNGLQGSIEVVATAAADRECVSRLTVNGSSMGHSLRTGDRDGALDPIDVAVTTLDRLFSDRPHLHWRRLILKIDVEGCESEVLAGAQHLFATGNVAAVIWERSDFQSGADLEVRTGEIVDFLNSRGFNHFRMENGELGGELIAIDAKSTLSNIYSLAPQFRRMERYV